MTNDMPSGTYEMSWVTGETETRKQITETALTGWRAFLDDPEAELPWNTAIAVVDKLTPDGTHEQAVTVTVRWERVQTR